MGAAYHEAGHAVVAWALGLKVGRLAIAIGGDDAKGSADIEHDQEYPLVDRSRYVSQALMPKNCLRLQRTKMLDGATTEKFMNCLTALMKMRVTRFDARVIKKPASC
jgi:hypothetical protein